MTEIKVDKYKYQCITQGGLKGHDQTARVDVSGNEEQELHRSWVSDS